MWVERGALYLKYCKKCPLVDVGNWKNASIYCKAEHPHSGTLIGETGFQEIGFQIPDYEYGKMPLPENCRFKLEILLDDEMKKEN